MTLTSYTPEKCQIAINHLKKGKSVATMPHHLGVAPSTMYAWMKDIPEFGRAVEMGKAMGHEWWENEMMETLRDSRGFNTAGWMFTMKCQYGMVEPPQPVQAPQQSTNTAPDLFDAVVKSNPV